MSSVRPEFGPTLPELVGPRLRAAPRWVRIGLVLVVLALIALIAAYVLTRNKDRTTVVVRGPVAFNLLYQPEKLGRVAPKAGELRLQTPAGTVAPASVVVRPVHLPAYTGDPSGFLPVYATTLEEQMQHQYPGFVVRSEGRARVNSQPGYQIQFQTTLGGHTTYGRRTLLFKDEPAVRDGADITLLAARSPVIPNPDAVGSNGPTKLPYRSFRLGTERP